MKAMIFAAGLGTRLKPLTDNIPKALVKINNKTLLEILIIKLKNFGFDEIGINVHHFSDKIISFLEKKNFFNIKIKIFKEKKLLDTGGALKKSENFFKDEKAFLVHNVDILSDINLKNFYDFHIKNKPMVSIAVQNRKSSRSFLFNDKNFLIGWRNLSTKEIKLCVKNQNYKALAFSGIHIISPDIFKKIKDNGNFSIVKTYLEICKKEKIIAFEHTKNYCMDLGTHKNLKEAENYLKK